MTQKDTVCGPKGGPSSSPSSHITSLVTIPMTMVLLLPIITLIIITTPGGVSAASASRITTSAPCHSSIHAHPPTPRKVRTARRRKRARRPFVRWSSAKRAPALSSSLGHRPKATLHLGILKQPHAARQHLSNAPGHSSVPLRRTVYILGRGRTCASGHPAKPETHVQRGTPFRHSMCDKGPNPDEALKRANAHRAEPHAGIYKARRAVTAQCCISRAISRRGQPIDTAKTSRKAPSPVVFRDGSVRRVPRRTCVHSPCERHHAVGPRELPCHALVS